MYGEQTAWPQDGVCQLRPTLESTLYIPHGLMMEGSRLGPTLPESPQPTAQPRRFEQDQAPARRRSDMRRPASGSLSADGYAGAPRQPSAAVYLVRVGPRLPS